MHLFVIFNLETTDGAIWHSILPSSIVLTSCFISSRSFSVEINVSQFEWLLLDLNGLYCSVCQFVSNVYLYEVFAPPITHTCTLW